MGIFSRKNKNPIPVDSDLSLVGFSDSEVKQRLKWEHDFLLKLVNDLRYKHSLPPVTSLLDTNSEVPERTFELGELFDKGESFKTFNLFGYTNRCLDVARSVMTKIREKDKNVLFSPLSLDMALAVLAVGASGEALKQLAEFVNNTDILSSEIERADTLNAQSISQNGYNTRLHIANFIWLNDRYSLVKMFKDVVEATFGAMSSALDFASPDEVADIINKWCSANTNEMISEIVSPFSISTDVALIICNALYMESSWKESWEVHKGEFTTSDGRVIKLDEMLYDTVETYYETGNARAFGKDYNGDMLFIGIRPDEGVGIESIDLQALVASQTRYYEVEVAMPKLTFEHTCDSLIDALKSLGVTQIFKETKDLAGIVNESTELCVSKIVQKCRIELDENGTKAAAVTEMAVADFGCADIELTPTKQVYLDRPFYFLIMDSLTGAVLFIGEVNNLD